MATPAHLQIVLIPCNGSPKRLLTVPLLDISPVDGIHDKHKDIEKQLKHIPNIKSLTNSKRLSFSWPHRRLLIGQPFTTAASETWSAVYLIYMTSRENVSGLAPNEHLNKLMRDLESKGRATAMEEFKAYGDAFVFRMKAKAEKGSEEGGEGGTRAEYVDMPRDFVSDGLADVVLRRLLMYPWSWE